MFLRLTLDKGSIGPAGEAQNADSGINHSAKTGVVRTLSKALRVVQSISIHLIVLVLLQQGNHSLYRFEARSARDNIQSNMPIFAVQRQPHRSDGQ